MKNVIIFLLMFSFGLSKTSAWTISEKTAIGCSVGAGVVGAGLGYWLYTKIDSDNDNPDPLEKQLTIEENDKSFQNGVLALSLMIIAGAAIGIPTYYLLIKHTDSWRKDEIKRIIKHCDKESLNLLRVIYTNPLKAVKGFHCLMKEITNGQNYLDEYRDNKNATKKELDDAQRNLNSLAHLIANSSHDAQNNPYYEAQRDQELKKELWKKRSGTTSPIQESLDTLADLKDFYNSLQSKKQL